MRGRSAAHAAPRPELDHLVRLAEQAPNVLDRYMEARPIKSGADDVDAAIEHGGHGIDQALREEVSLVEHDQLGVDLEQLCRGIERAPRFRFTRMRHDPLGMIPVVDARFHDRDDAPGIRGGTGTAEQFRRLAREHGSDDDRELTGSLCVAHDDQQSTPPDPTMTDPARDISIWQQLLEPDTAPLLGEIADHLPPTPADITRWRRQYDPHVVRAAIALCSARLKGAAKFPDHPDLVADVDGVEQATSALVAKHKAGRYAAISCATIDDLCCGIGGDAMSLHTVAPVRAVDLDPLRTWMCSVNADCDVLTTDVVDLVDEEGAFHLDPARRADGRRVRNLADYQPGPEVIERLVAGGRPGAIKLGPGVDFDDLPAPERCELELISEHGTLVQAVLWTGALAHHPGERTATTLPDGASLTAAPGAARTLEMCPPGQFIHTVDPAIERAGLFDALAAALALPAIHPRLGLLTSDEPVESPWLTPFEVLAELPWRERKVRAWLDTHDGGIVEVKTRGRAVDPDAAQRALRGEGHEPYTVFVLRDGERRFALICRRPGTATGPVQ
jgi:hypothetical protein